MYTVVHLDCCFDHMCVLNDEYLQKCSMMNTYGNHAFMRCNAMQGSACFLTGVVLILIKWALVGICVETYGFWLLFSGFFPTVLGFLRRLPVLGSILDLPVLKTVWGTPTVCASISAKSNAWHNAELPWHNAELPRVCLCLCLHSQGLSPSLCMHKAQVLLLN